MSTPPRLDEGFRVFSDAKPDEGIFSDRLRTRLAEMAEEDRLARVQARRDAIIALVLAVACVIVAICAGQGHPWLQLHLP